MLWTQPIEVALARLSDAISSARETGEIIYACYSLEHRITDLMARGDRLDEVWLESVKALEFAQRIKFRHVSDILASTQQFIQSLQGQAAGTAVGDESALEVGLLDSGIPVAICFHWILQIQRHFLFGDPETALECAEKAKPLLWSARCHIQFANYCVYASLALAEVYSTASDQKQAEIRPELTANVQLLERWAQSCFATFGHKHLLVTGELARVDRREVEAMQSYERAARLAREHGFIQDQALANELAGRCCLASGLERAAHAYLGEARDCYLRWGALGKVAQLDRLYPAIKPAAAPVSRTTIEKSTEQLDIGTIIKTAQAISSEMVFENLIKSLMVIAVENAGAERGLLILPREDDHRVEAEATIEGGAVIVHLPEQPLATAALPQSIVHHVVHTRRNVILDDASAENPFTADPYIRQKHARSVLCLPLLKQGTLVAVLYLENNLSPSVFTGDRILLLNVLASQAAISLENTRLYRDLAEREAKIRRLVDANIIGIFIWDFDGRILEANDAFLRIVGYDREDILLGLLSLTDLTPPEWAGRTAQTLQEVRMTGPARPFEKEYFRKDGSRVPVLIGSASFEDGEKQGVSFVLDLTERKRAEAEAREMQMQLAHANRVATMGQLTASIAHEVNQPIAATVANARAGLRWLGAKPPNLDEAQQAFGRIVRDGDRAGAVVGRIRALIKGAPPRDEHVEINAAIRDVIEITHSEAMKNGVSVRTELVEGLPLVPGDRVELQQVILNLVLNAFEAMSEMGEGPREVLITTSKTESGEVAVAVCDTGPGLAPAAIEHLFEAFHTTKPNGLGLGLSICRSIIEGHGGRLWASANSPRGAVLQFTLPADPDIASRQ